MEEEQKVLIVDDDRILGDSMGRAFRRTGCRVIVCSTGYEALQRVAQEHFDLVITDYQMPSMDGLELTKELRQRSFTATIIGMSCYEAGGEFRQAGADGFFRKPLMPDMVHHIMVRRMNV